MNINEDIANIIPYLASKISKEKICRMQINITFGEKIFFDIEDRGKSLD